MLLLFDHYEPIDDENHYQLYLRIDEVIIVRQSYELIDNDNHFSYI